jgi:aspartate 1-decarboxylase
MLRTMMKSNIHRATVAQADLHSFVVSDLAAGGSR